MSEENTVVENTEVVNESSTVESPSEVSFIDSLDPELREASNLKDFKSPNDLAKSYMELQKMVGNSVRVPSADASPEAISDFKEKIKSVDGVLFKDDAELKYKLGTPKTVDEYDLESKIKSEIYDYIAPQVDVYKNKAHELGLTKDQAQGLLEMQQDLLDKEITQMENQRIETESMLKKRWGSDYDVRMDAAKKAAGIYAEKYGDEVSKLLNSPAGNNPVFISMLADMSENFVEKGHEGMGKVEFGLTPHGAAAKIQEKRADRGFMKAYNDSMDPGHKHALAEMQKLYSIAYDS